MSSLIHLEVPQSGETLRNINVNNIASSGNVTIAGNLAVTGSITDGGGLTGITGATGYFQHLQTDELVFNGATGQTGFIGILTTNNVIGNTGAFSGLLNVNGGLSGSTGTLNNLNTTFINGQNGIIIDMAIGEIPMANFIATQPWAIGGSDVVAPNKIMTIGYNSAIDRGQLYSFDQSAVVPKNVQINFPGFPATVFVEGNISASGGITGATGYFNDVFINGVKVGTTGPIGPTGSTGPSKTSPQNIYLANASSQGGTTGSSDQFVWNGTNNNATCSALNITYKSTTIGLTGTINVTDTTNTTTIAGANVSAADTSAHILSLGAVSNLSATQALWRVDIDILNGSGGQSITATYLNIVP